MHFIVNKVKGNIWLKLCMTVSENFAGAVINVCYMMSPWVRQSLVDSCYSLSAKRGMNMVYDLDEDYDYPLGYEGTSYEERSEEDEDYYYINNNNNNNLLLDSSNK
jgi:hypothetical protein